MGVETISVPPLRSVLEARRRATGGDPRLRLTRIETATVKPALNDRSKILIALGWNEYEFNAEELIEAILRARGELV